MLLQIYILKDNPDNFNANDNNSTATTTMDHPNNGNSNTSSTAGSTVSNSNNLKGPYGQVITLLDLYRSSLQSVMTQFVALFQDNPRESLISAPPSFLLSSWFTNQIHTLLNVLKIYLPKL